MCCLKYLLNAFSHSFGLYFSIVAQNVYVRDQLLSYYPLDGEGNPKSPFLAQGPVHPKLCGKWPLHGWDSHISVLGVWAVAAANLGSDWAKGVWRESEWLEKVISVLVHCVWLHPRCNWGLVRALLSHHSSWPELPLSTLWVKTWKLWTLELGLDQTFQCCVLGHNAYIWKIMFA